MNHNGLQIVIHNAFYRCIHVMGRKSGEYSPNEDRLENFKVAGAADGVSPEEALWGMVRKQLASLNMMCRALTPNPPAYHDPYPQAVWEEKLTDAHNYLFLLEALVKERYGWAGSEGGHTGPPLRGQE